MSPLEAVRILGTSHVSRDSVEEIERAIREEEPEVVALELDPVRLNALLGDSEPAGGELFPRILKRFQEYIGSRTGVMPGSEMLKAYETAGELDAEVYLIDQDIRVTFERLKGVSRKEKVRAVMQLVLATLGAGKLDLESVPEDRELENMLNTFAEKFPELFEVLVEERNTYMLEALKGLQSENDTIIAVVGAGHRGFLEENL